MISSMLSSPNTLFYILYISLAPIAYLLYSDTIPLPISSGIASFGITFIILGIRYKMHIATDSISIKKNMPWFGNIFFLIGIIIIINDIAILLLLLPILVITIIYSRNYVVGLTNNQTLTYIWIANMMLCTIAIECIRLYRI